MPGKEKQPREYQGVRDEIRQQQLKTKDMSLKGKLKYFWDYYKVHTIAGIFALIIIISLIHDIVTAKDYNFYACMFNSSRISSESLAAAFTEYAGLDTEHHECLIDTSLSLSAQTYNQYDLATSQKLVAQVQANDLDAVVMNSDVFYSYSLIEMFADLRTILNEDELARYKDNLYYIDYAEVKQAKEDTNYDEEYLNSFNDQDVHSTENLLAEAEIHRHPENMEAPVPVGIYMNNSPFITKTGIYEKEMPILGIISTSQRMETGKKYLEFLWNENIDFSQMTETNYY